MVKQKFEFEVYRINVMQAEPTLFAEMNKPVKTDQDIVAILEHAIEPDFKVTFSGSKNVFEWAMRGFCQYHHTRTDGVG